MREWIAEADDALYAAKRRGRHRVADGGHMALRDSPPRMLLPKEIDAAGPI